LIDCLTAIKAFDTTYKDDADFSLASISCRRLVQFLWAAANNHLNIVVSIPHDTGYTKKFKDELQEKFILGSSLISPNPGSLAAQSDATLSGLSGSIRTLTDHLELDCESRKTDKADEKIKFSKLPESLQSIILKASSKSSFNERIVVSPELEKCLQQSSLSRARTHINQSLASFGCQLDASSMLVAAIMAEDLIWTRSSKLPKKIIIFLMGKPSPSSSKMLQKYWLCLHLQESNSNQGLDSSAINKLSEFKFDYPKSPPSLCHFVNNMTGISRIVFYGDSALPSSLGFWIDHLDKRELLYKINFDSDLLFGLKLCLPIDRSIQLFLQSCQDAASIDNVNFKYLDFTFNQECIKRGCFSCNPTAPFWNYSMPQPQDVIKMIQIATNSAAETLYRDPEVFQITTNPSSQILIKIPIGF